MAFEFQRESDPDEKGSMSVGEAGKKGGERTKETHDREFYQKIGKKGGDTVSRERGSEFYSEIGKKGGEKKGAETQKNLEPEGYSELGRKAEDLRSMSDDEE